MESTIAKLKTIDDLQVGDKVYIVFEQHRDCRSTIKSQPYTYHQQTVGDIWFHKIMGQDYISSSSSLGGVRFPVEKGKTSYVPKVGHCGTVGSLYGDKVVLVTTDKELAIAMYNELRHAMRLVRDEVYKNLLWVD